MSRLVDVNTEIRSQRQRSCRVWMHLWGGGGGIYRRQGGALGLAGQLQLSVPEARTAPQRTGAGLKNKHVRDLTYLFRFYRQSGRVNACRNVIRWIKF